MDRNVLGTKTSSGISKGATAGAIVGALLFLAMVVALLIWYRRKMRPRNSIAAQREGKKDIPAPAETVLNRPDPIEKSPTELNTVRVYPVSSNTTIDLDPESQRTSPNNSHHNPTNVNPFDDGTSIQTAGTEGTNVIPITLVSPDTDRPPSEASDSTFPVRPVRSPDLNLDHVNISGDSVRGTAPYAVSQRSGVSGVSTRNSFMSNASFSSDFLNEAPMIITPHKGAVRQVLGVVKAEVIKAPGSLSPSNSADGLKPLSLASRPSVGSPLASTSFGPADIVKEVDEPQLTDPFCDEASVGGNRNTSPAASVTTFGHSSTGAVHDSHSSNWVAETPNLPWSRSNDSRPSSMSTQSGSVVDITSAKRVNVGLSLNRLHSSEVNYEGTPRSSHRTTVGRLISPPLTVSETETLHEQQQRALAHAHARAQAQGVVDQSKRLSGSSVLSGTSTRADSILESFPFVPPSPISNRPVRSPPVSPLGQQSFSSPILPSGQHTINVSPPTPHIQQVFTENTKDFADAALPPPPDRRMLGLSTASQLSTSSSGLGSFPFQIDSGSGIEGAGAPSAFNGRQRASLDTLALTSDLSSYPLGFDRESVQVSPKS